jgi:uncharacterized membrane protein
MTAHPRWVTTFISTTHLDEVARAIAEIESTTSAEIRVHLDHRCPGDPLRQAAAVFERLGMHETAERNGVLIFIAVADHKLAVIGDTAIHERVGEAYWRRLAGSIAGHLRAERAGEGLVEAVRDVGAALRAHFPRRPDDRNELSDRVSLG